MSSSYDFHLNYSVFYLIVGLSISMAIDVANFVKK